jgi:hypothetical protein
VSDVQEWPTWRVVEWYALVKGWHVLRRRNRPEMWGMDPVNGVLLVPSGENPSTSTEGIILALAAYSKVPVDDLLAEIESARAKCDP